MMQQLLSSKEGSEEEKVPEAKAPEKMCQTNSYTQPIPIPTTARSILHSKNVVSQKGSSA
jgi:hypothetical protein